MRSFSSFKIILFAFVVIITSCTAAGPGMFGKKSFHEQYGSKLTNAGLNETTLGTAWFAAADKALNSPALISIPYKEVGYFAAEKPRAVGLRFTAQRGQKLLVELTKRPANNFILYTELWKVETNKPTLLQSFDTTLTKFSYEIDNAGEYILRIQPELLRSGDYTLSISIGSVLGFPVAGKSARIGSVWGDARDGGARNHEGIDIFAAKRTPAVAAYDGTVTRVNENALGGKAVWLRPEGKDYTLYYAHLDEQLVSSGQRVKLGDTVGLVGNTGNARTTPPHLHFGIYGFGGAMDPLPFVNPAIKNPANVPTALGNNLKEVLRLKSKQQIQTINRAVQLNANTLIMPVAVSAKEYRVEMPDGSLIDVPVGAVETAEGAIRQGKLKIDTYIYESPDSNSPRKMMAKASDSLKVLAYFNDYAFVSFGEAEGWVPVLAIS